MNDKVIVVTGATGQQGGATARHLLRDGWTVKALVRDPQKDAARALADLGAQLVPGDLNDRASVDAALAGAYGVFSVQNFWLPDVGTEGEIRQGKLLADAAQAAAVRHFVYTSVAAAERGLGQKHFESKWIIEQHIHSLSLPFTILRPVAFMDNINWTQPLVSNGFYQSWGLRPDKPLQIVAVEDIGAVAAAVFADRDEFLGRTLELAGDELTEPEIAATLGRVIGRPVDVQYPDMPADFTPDEEMLAMGAFFNGEGYTVDIPALRDRFSSLRTYEQWLRETGWEDLPILPLPDASGEAWSA